MIYRFVPGFGDEVAASRTNRKTATDGSQAAALISSPAALVSQGIKTHSSRGGGNDGGGVSQGGARPTNPLSGGVAAHSSRGWPGRRRGQRRPLPRTPAPQQRPSSTGTQQHTQPRHRRWRALTTQSHARSRPAARI